ncbi:hypothetical protein B1B04_04805 [Lysinibacillus sp. KCTC 33748]|uniref:DUF418 domain-containing protein n=1 Tax=unclassified Lysinibacillus TaxID=2636778 RepID=UPI0009A7B2B2|nr:MULTISPECIES: DUF418 domain-containing protein [unclassified Lysinibacillus]OXS76497.1 hypothetical protein B1B04_04805 [Lysinibacillus sp. KCTC 33748]SKB43602.1 uncharacterized protein SAMN06295926_102444 [Lysinibacillus sp. AC-3]
MKVQQRLPLIDMLRGFAVLGTLGTNIWIFAYLGDISYITTSNYSGWWSLNDFLRMVVLFFVNGKLLGLLTIMFGVGLELKYQQALRKGNAWPGMYIWTIVFLFMEGLIHFTLVMEYDILMSYAVTAIIVVFIVKFGDKAIKRALYVFGSFHAVMILLILVSSLLGANAYLTGVDPVVSLYENGTWFEQIQYRLTNFLYYRTEAIFIIPMNIFLFLLGVKLMRNGVFLQNDKGRQARQKLFKIGIFIGVPLNLLIFIPGGVFDLPVRYLFAPILSIGYIGILGKMLEYKKLDWLWKRFGEIGKMSLSCYVLQNTMASIIFYGWGLGLGGKLNSIEVIGIWLTLSLFQLFIAHICIKHFHVGPMEWIRKHAIQSVTQK